LAVDYAPGAPSGAVGFVEPVGLVGSGEGAAVVGTFVVAVGLDVTVGAVVGTFVVSVGRVVVVVGVVGVVVGGCATSVTGEFT
jgi:hypothetical protein